MWSVIRARQGLPHEHTLEPSFQANTQHLVTFSSKPQIEQLPADSVTLAFERATHPKLTRLVGAEELVHRQKALAMIDKLCSAPIEIAKFLEAGCVPALAKATEDADVMVRVLASHVLILVAREKAGREHMLAAGTIPVLQRLISDSERQVRGHACQALSALCIESAHAVTDAVIAAGVVDHLVARTDGEEPSVMPHVLYALKMCLMHPLGLERAIACGAIAAMATLLASDQPAVREGACRNLFCLAVPLEGKRAALDEAAVPGLLPRLVALLSEPVPAVQAEAAGALMALTVAIDAKHACIERGACETLVAIVGADATGDRLRANALKLITSLAEAPRGRQALTQAVPTLVEIAAGRFAPSDAEHAALHREAAQRAHAKITWTP